VIFPGMIPCLLSKDFGGKFKSPFYFFILYPGATTEPLHSTLSTLTANYSFFFGLRADTCIKMLAREGFLVGI
jgi:hypothetical protein